LDARFGMIDFYWQDGRARFRGKSTSMLTKTVRAVKQTATFLTGHSAGAHLAALVCIDRRYLAAEALPTSIGRSSVPVGTAACDASERAKRRGPLRSASTAPIGPARPCA